MRFMGLDVGERRIGVALSDPEGRMAYPLSVVERRSDAEAIEAIARLVKAHGVAKLIIGLPHTLEGLEGMQAEAVRGFVEQLRGRTDVPYELWDERLSTVEAERRLREAGVRRERRAQVRDTLAATIILQSYLDYRQRFPSA